jgi:bifunctional DNA-binding transcriptional regulator/antitoxin component of YhaV-PrlF toxin-antitoxin module
MTVAVKNDNKAPLVIPRAARRKAGFKSGQELEIKASGGVITILPKLPTADDECTPAGRRAIDAVLKESEAEFRERRGAGPFSSADEMIAHMKAQLRKRAGARRAKRAR